MPDAQFFAQKEVAGHDACNGDKIREDCSSASAYLADSLDIEEVADDRRD